MNSTNIIENVFAALAGSDSDRISAVFTEDAEWLSPAGNATAVALGRTHHMVGRDTITRFFAEDFPRMFSRDLSVEFRSIHVNGEWAMVEATMTATLTNGNPYSNDYCLLFELRDDLIHRVREYVDTARGLRTVLGEVPRETQQFHE
ncbi:nuclear transport factor 2 family protein [Streptomyces sp. NPDC059070]|uniref:nuclear transport factor 2 family protein n=1 Tax=Streptomyces sp. NPDC059070 TaxID=3346713 RepID=UPI00367519B0